MWSSTQFWRMALSILAISYLSGCAGKASFVEELNSYSAQDAQADTFQGEFHNIMNAINGTILAGVDNQQNVLAAGCKPKFKFSFSGVGFEFPGSAGGPNCKLSGTVMVKLFPLRASVDLDVIGMKYIESMRFDADINLNKSSGGTTVAWELLNGRINLRNVKFLPVDELVLNGRVTAQLGSNFVFASRTNAFDAGTGFGVSLISDINRLEGKRMVSACLLTGAIGNDPMAGNTNQCLSILK